MYDESQLRKIADHYGLDSQLKQAVEEMAELIQAFNKYTRSRGSGQPTTTDELTARLNIIEEVADVEIMLSQVKYLLDISDDEIEAIKCIKLDRTLDRMRTT